VKIDGVVVAKETKDGAAQGYEVELKPVAMGGSWATPVAGGAGSEDVADIDAGILRSWGD